MFIHMLETIAFLLHIITIVCLSILAVGVTYFLCFMIYTFYGNITEFFNSRGSNLR